MNILAIDLGTSTGFCANLGDRFFLGSWQLATPKEIREWGKTRMTRRRDPRVERLANNISAYPLTMQERLRERLDLIIFEDVLFSSTTYACQLWASLRAAVWLSTCPRIECLPVQTLKIFATGRGNADKAAMKKAFDREGIAGDYNDDAIDAYFLHKWAKAHIRL